jgi:hypothetical protein
MSDDKPTEPTVPIEPTEPTVPIERVQASPEFETVGPEGPTAGSRRVAVIAAVAVAVVAALGGGAYAAYSFLAGDGPQPADVLPASTLAVASIDLDPSAGQKIAAIKTIRRFPALKKSLGLQADDDLREFIFDEVVKESDCKGLDFDKDVKPWLGKRAAFAAVDLGEDDPAPAIALQVSDAAEAKKGFDAIVECTDPDDFAYVVGDDYLIASDSAEHAKAILDKGRTSPLSDDAAYQKWTGEAGDAGVLNFYVAKKAMDYLVDELEGFGGGFDEDFEGSFDEESGAEFEQSAAIDDPGDTMKDQLKDFQGLGGTVRFADGGMELSVVAGGLKDVTHAATVGKQVGDLPKDTAVAMGFGVPDNYAELLVDQLNGMFGAGSDDLVTEAEKETGLDLPEDLQTVLGDAITLSLGGEAPTDVDDLDDPANIPAGLLIHGDADKIKAIIAKVEEHLGMKLSDVPVSVEGAGEKLALSPSSDYASELLKAGDLGSDDGFDEVVPEADRASGVLFVDFDSPWRDTIVDAIAEDSADDAEEFDENTEALESLGLSAWYDGGISHLLVKVTTD